MHVFVRSLIVSFLLLSSLPAQDAPAADYYAGVYRLSGAALRSALHNLIDGHTVVSYDGLYTAFPSTDSKPNGKVWDIYSDIPGGTPPYEYEHGLRKCGSYNSENDCYNREHSWPDSWLGATNPARSDLFHMYPTDGYVNNRRSNYPFGEVSNPTWTSMNGSKVGPNTAAGYSGTVFEPINEYKGDLARSMMYMSVRYFTEDTGFTTTVATNKSELLGWYAAMLYRWHVKDTVSMKEIVRNNAIETFQKNRNPFIDHPEFAAEIWNTSAAPVIGYVQQLSSTGIEIDLTRYVDSVSVVTAGNIMVDKGIGNPVSVQWGVNNDVSKVRIVTSPLQPGTQYQIQLKNVKSINGVAMKDTAVFLKTSGVASVPDGAVPDGFVLAQNYPNPFNPLTTIEFTLPREAFTSLSVFDLQGRELEVVLQRRLASGTYRLPFNAGMLPSGIYIYQLRSGSQELSRKMMLIK
ncbi:MAG: endonuclease [Bacteroidetes bacterium]|nr:endonuclease [Bacteroidota bacterium]